MIDQELLLQKLKALPADKIKRVELIMNPGAEYEGSEHEGGIVNIILEDDLYGWNVFQMNIQKNITGTSLGR